MTSQTTFKRETPAQKDARRIAINREIAKDRRIGKREARLIHKLLGTR